MADQRGLTAYDALDNEHRHMLEVESGLDRDIINARGYDSITDVSRLEYLGFAKVQRRPGLLIPLRGPDGSNAGYQLRPNKPRNNRNKEPIKYESPQGSNVRIDCPSASLELIGDPSTPLWTTEGVKKGDSLAGRGLCAIDVIGVWNFKGRNPYGGHVVSTDLDFIAFNGRTNYFVFDHDVMTKRSVAQALERFSEIVRRKGAKPMYVYLPDLGDGKTGVDDYFAAGHTVEELQALAEPELRVTETDSDKVRIPGTAFFERGGQFWQEIHTKDGPSEQRLTNFTAQAVEEIQVHDGIDSDLYISLTGQMANGRNLPAVQIPAQQVHELAWIAGRWGYSPIITSEVKGARDRVREIMQHKSSLAGIKHRDAYSHTGWREIGGVWRYLMPNEPLGTDGVEVQMESAYARYGVPRHPDQLVESVRASLRFLDSAERRVTIPMLTLAYLAPLQSILKPSFTMWLRASSGSYKSTLTGLLMSHFGDFSFNTPPATWEGSARGVERFLFDFKDCLAWIDDFNPRQSDRDMAKQFEKADQVLRSLGNLQGRVRMKSDLKQQKSFPPQAMLISTGEIYPVGESVIARTLAIEMTKGTVDLESLTTCQGEANLYRNAMSGYIAWLTGRYGKLREELPTVSSEHRSRANKDIIGQHARTPNVIAAMQTAMGMFTSFAVDVGAATESEMGDLYDEAWSIFCDLASEQTVRLKDEGIAEIFLNTLDTLLGQHKVVFDERGSDHHPKVGVDLVGWYDTNNVYMDPIAAWNVVSKFHRAQGTTLPGTEASLRTALHEKAILIKKDDGHFTTRARVNGRVHRVVQLDMNLLPFKELFSQQLAMDEYYKKPDDDSDGEGQLPLDS